MKISQSSGPGEEETKAFHRWKLVRDVQGFQMKTNPLTEYTTECEVQARTTEENVLGVLISNDKMSKRQIEFWGVSLDGLPVGGPDSPIQIFIGNHLEYCAQFQRPHLQKD